MSRVNVPPTSVTHAGVAAGSEVTGDTVNNHSFPNTNSNIVLLARNADGASAHNVTVHLAETVDGQAVTSRVTSVPASTTMFFGPFPSGEYGSVVNVDVDSTQLKLTTYQLG